MSPDLLQELAQAWLAAFDPEVWTLPLVVTLIGAAVGAAAMTFGRGAHEQAEAEDEGRQLDLQRRRETVVEAVRALDLEKDKLNDDDYQAERRALLAHGAQAMRALAEDAMTDGPKTLAQALEAERSQLGEERYRAIQAILDGSSPGAAPAAAPSAGPSIGPRWQGALWTLGAFGVLAALYLVLTGLEARTDAKTAQESAGAEEQGLTPDERIAMQRLREDPTDLVALNTMTDFSIRRQQWGEAASMSRRALAADPKDPTARTFAALLAFRGGDSDAGIAMLDGVIAERPTFALALQYRGILAFQIGDLQGAIDALESAVEHTEDPEMKASLRQFLAQARSRLAAASAPPEIRGTIQLADGVDAASFGAGASVFVSVRAEDGPPMPLRAKKLPLGPFPLEFTLSPADSPMAGGPLPERVVLVVKVDLDGNPMGDAAGAPKAQLQVTPGGDEPVVVELGL